MKELQWVVENWYIVGPIVITAASVIVRLTPTETDNKILAGLLMVLEKIALNNKPIEVKNGKV